MPILWLALGIILCGLKFPFNWLGVIGNDPERKAVLIETQWGLTSGDPRIEDALVRIREPGRPLHDASNVPIELARYAFKTWESDHPDGPTIGAWYVKAMSALIVWPWLLFAAYKLIRLFW